MSHRPIRMVAMYGNDQLWSENPDYGMTVRAKDVSIRAHDHGKIFGKIGSFPEIDILQMFTIVGNLYLVSICDSSGFPRLFEHVHGYIPDYV